MLHCIAKRKNGERVPIKVPEPNKRELFLKGIKEQLDIGGERLSRKDFHNKGFDEVITNGGKLLFPLRKKPKPQKGRRRPNKFDRRFRRNRPMPTHQRRAA